MKCKKKQLQDTPIWKTERLTAVEKLILLALKFHIGTNSSTYVSVGTLAKEVGVCTKTIHRGLKTLRTQRWIVVQNREHTTSLYSLFEPKFKDPELGEVGNQCPTPCVTVSHPPGTPDTHKDIKTKTKDKNQEKVFVPAIAGTTANEDNMSKSAADILAKMSKPKEFKKTGPITAHTLALRWKTDLPLLFPEVGFAKALTAKEIGMFKLFIQAMPKVNAEEVLSHLLKNWGGYCQYVIDVTGTKGFPELPSIPFLLKYVAEGVNYFYKVDEPVQLIAQPKKIKKAKTITVDESSTSDTITLAELEEIESALGG